MSTTDPTGTTGADHPHRDLVARLRAAADFFEARPDTQLLENGYACESFSTFEGLIERAAELGGEWIPDDPITGPYFHVRLGGMPEGVRYSLFCSAELVGAPCEVEATVTRTEFVVHDAVAADLATLSVSASTVARYIEAIDADRRARA